MFMIENHNRILVPKVFLLKSCRTKSSFFPSRNRPKLFPPFSLVCHGLIIFKTAHFASLFFSLSLSLSLFLSPSLPLSLSQAAFFLAVIVSIPGEQEEEEDEEALSGKLKMATALDASDEIKLFIC